ncbi:DUF2784 domain-containing protein [Nocardioides sp. CPCC 206347]|jgi:hypothetical protein|uniref:DUF2784 domain-containing protein n=1 Tax=unclassified Nocardioides TaxID=2615069 RepID=UPI0036192AF9
MHRLVAAAACVVHMLFVAFTVLGGFLAWLMPWVFLPHLAAAAWGGRMSISRAACPLSRIEDWGREGAGRQPMSERGFIAHYFEGNVYPAKIARRVEVLVGTLVVGSWLGFVVR